MEDGKGYGVPEEIAEVFLEYISALECREISVKSIFKAKRAIFYGKEAEKSRIKFWNLVRELYPELKGKPLTYDRFDKTVEVSD